MLITHALSFGNSFGENLLKVIEFVNRILKGIQTRANQHDIIDGKNFLDIFQHLPGTIRIYFRTRSYLVLTFDFVKDIFNIHMRVHNVVGYVFHILIDAF